jgi:N-acetyl sugar amidotransferase
MNSNPAASQMAPIQCRRCLYTTTHPLGLALDHEGICSGCRIHEEKDALDWPQRWERLQTLVAPYRVASGRTYDCIVPVTGAQDTYYILHIVKEKLGLNPLLVHYNKYYNTPLGIRNLANLRIRFNCDLLIQNVNPVAVKNITRTTLRQFGSLYWHVLAGQTVFPVQTAVRYGIPLIIWGAHQGLEQVGMFSHEHEVEMSRRYRKDHDLMGHEADDLLSIFDTLTEDDIFQYRYPCDADLAHHGVRGIYLGNYVRWDPMAQHQTMVASHGYIGAGFGRTFDTYDHVDCWNYMGLHDQLKTFKNGYGKATDHACREIRHGRLTREQAQALVSHHEDQASSHAELFCEWLGVDASGLRFIMDQHRHPRYWAEQAPGKWVPRTQATAPATTLPTISGFEAQSHLAHGQTPRYITVGKGYPA